jgi:hypothetical protein
MPTSTARYRSFVQALISILGSYCSAGQKIMTPLQNNSNNKARKMHMQASKYINCDKNTQYTVYTHTSVCYAGGLYSLTKGWGTD